jgi:hypothetical protein
MTVRELIKQLMDEDMDEVVSVAVGDDGASPVDGIRNGRMVGTAKQGVEIVPETELAEKEPIA